MTSPELDDGPETTTEEERIVAGHVYEAALRERDHVIATIASHGNWVLASLLAANAGALAFVADSRDVHSLWPAAAFALGGLLALASGIAQWASARAALPIISGLVRPLSITRRGQVEPPPPGAYARVARIARAGIGFAIGSILCLSIGMVMTGLELQQAKSHGGDTEASRPQLQEGQ